MDFIDRLQALGVQAQKQLDHIKTEEATKNALVMPFIAALGYDVFDPLEVVPEFTADVGTKKGEKVDYAIMRDGEVAILIECKWCGCHLDVNHASQLFRYYTVTEAKVGVLTNGIIYQFFTDLDNPNKMDAKPFLEFDLLRPDSVVVDQLKRFSKDAFDVDDVLESASELRYTREIKRILAAEAKDPSEPFVRFIAKQVYPGIVTQGVREAFCGYTKRAFQQFVNDRVTSRLQSALEGEDDKTEDEAPEEPGEVESAAVEDVASAIETTDEEIEGFHIVRAIVAEVIDPERVIMRDTKSYCGILADDNNRRPICRLRFNAKTKKYVGLFDDEKNEEWAEIDRLTDIYKHAEKLRKAARRWTRSE